MDRILLRGWAALATVGGGLLLLGGLAELRVDESAPLSEAVQSSALLLHLGLNLAGYVGILLGLPALAVELARKRPVTATAASLLLGSGLAFMVAATTFTVFFAPAIAAREPALLDEPWSGAMGALQVGYPIFFLSIAVFSAAVLWTGALPRASGGLLLASVVASAADLPLDGAVLGGAAFAWMGFAAWRGQA